MWTVEWKAGYQPTWFAAGWDFLYLKNAFPYWVFLVWVLFIGSH